ncbi:transporter substrate-binding domain-containing protein [Desulfovibrio sp. OttesenSCG-928-G15]|nr:transporter substrate-binding domain-containing protein [Desulfovibrio sp. OttesenSCG-928-G15]
MQPCFRFMNAVFFLAALGCFLSPAGMAACMADGVQASPPVLVRVAALQDVARDDSTDIAPDEEGALGEKPVRRDGQLLRAGVYLSAPFIMEKKDGGYYGMLPDIWSAVEERLGLRTEYTLYHNLNELLEAAKEKQVDVILTNLAVTYERAAVLDFSYPWYDSGQRIMVSNENKGGDVLDELINNGKIRSYAWLLLLILFLALVTTIVRQKLDPDSQAGWRDGFASTLHDIILAAKSGQLQISHLGWRGKLISSAWMVIGVALVAYVTSTVTSAMTTVSLTHDINSVLDLHNKKVGVVAGSQAEQYLGHLGLKPVPFNELADIYAAFNKKELRAVVTDAPMLEYYVHTTPEAHAKVVGNLFNKDKYAIGFAKGHRDIVADVSKEIIRMHQRGVLEKIRTGYFGVQH